MKQSNFLAFALGFFMGYTVFKYQAAQDKIVNLEKRLEELNEKE